MINKSKTSNIIIESRNIFDSKKPLCRMLDNKNENIITIDQEKIKMFVNGKMISEEALYKNKITLKMYSIENEKNEEKENSEELLKAIQAASIQLIIAEYDGSNWFVYIGKKYVPIMDWYKDQEGK